MTRLPHINNLFTPSITSQHGEFRSLVALLLEYCSVLGFARRRRGGAILKQIGISQFFMFVHKLSDTTTFIDFPLIPSQFLTNFFQAVGNQEFGLGLFIDEAEK